MQRVLSLPVPSRVVSYRRVLIIAVHAALIPLSYLAAFALRFDFRIPAHEWRHYWDTLPYLLVLRFVVFERFGLFRGYWRHVGLRDLVALGMAVTLSALLFVATLFAAERIDGLPRSVIVLDWVLMIFLSGGLRFGARCLREGQLTMKAPRGKRTFIVGAGEAGELFLRQVLHEGRDTMNVVGLVDDDPERLGRSLHGVPVLGATADLASLVEGHRVTLLVIAIPSASPDTLRRVLDRCLQTGAAFKIVPSLAELVDGRARISQLRDVQIEDLLGREPVSLDLKQVEQDLTGKSILITGGAGSIGSELARQIARFRPARLVLLERAESPLYFAHLEVSRAFPDVAVVPVIANITNAERLEEVFSEHRPDYVFHTAAYKHVPMMEASVIEVVWNNVVGTLRVAQCAARQGVKKLVLISTDKAVNPTSMMGVTKRIAERIALELPSLRETGTDCRAVRFGNVLGSDGSVVPLFKRQLAAGGPITVTHPDMQRYFMTIPEAVQLVLLAGALPEAAGRITILDMGKPVRIVTLAEHLIRLSGLVPYQDVPIVFTGLRPGEKLNEELVASGEATVATTAEKIRIVHRNGADSAGVTAGVDRLVEALAASNYAAVMQAVSALVPEYVPDRQGTTHRAPQPAPPARRPDPRPRVLVPRLVRGASPA